MTKVLTIGTATQDVFLKSDKLKHVKDPEHLKKIGFPKGEAECFALGSKIDLDKIHMSFGGGAANAAVTFARQAINAEALINVGQDRVADTVVENLDKEGVKVNMIQSKNDNTAYSTILLTEDGSRTVLVYRGASDKLNKQDIKITTLTADWVYITPSRIPFSTIQWMVKSFKRRKIKVAMNPSNYYIEMGEKKLRPLLKKLDVLIMNREEATALTRKDYDDEHGIFRGFDKLTEGIAVMTEGRDGAMVSDGRYIYRSGIYKNEKVLDRTGAGDAFGSGFVAGLIKENDIAHALKLGSANATSVVELIGAQDGILRKGDFKKKRRFKYLDLDIEPLL